MKKMINKKKFGIIFIIILILIFFAYNLIYFVQIRSSITGNVIKSELKPILIISNVLTENKIGDGKCYSIIKGDIFNSGNNDAYGVLIKCNPALYPLLDENTGTIEVSQGFSLIKIKERIYFNMSVNNCEKKLRFECKTTCKDC